MNFEAKKRKITQYNNLGDWECWNIFVELFGSIAVEMEIVARHILQLNIRGRRDLKCIMISLKWSILSSRCSWFNVNK